jgi:hypothetical protein
VLLYLAALSSLRDHAMAMPDDHDAEELEFLQGG